MPFVGDVAYFLAPTWAIAILCYAIASANIFLSCRCSIKAWPKRLKAINWLFVGSVYLYMTFWDYSLADVRVLVRISLAFLIAGETAYHTDTFQDMIESSLALVKRLVRHG